MTKSEVEQLVFDAFLLDAPGFADTPVAPTAGPNPPDFICTTAGGSRIGVELTEWLHEEQITRERPRYQREQQYLSLIDSRSEPAPQNIDHVWIFVQAEHVVPRDQKTKFRSELYAQIGHVDRDWMTFRDRDSPHGVVVRDFGEHMTLQRYVSSLVCFPRARGLSPKRRVSWITFMPHGGPYSPRTALRALERTLNRKTSKYATLKTSANLAELYLLIYYQQGYHYNTPFDAPGFGFPEVATHLQTIASSEHGSFDRIFLYIPFTHQMARIY